MGASSKSSGIEALRGGDASTALTCLAEAVRETPRDAEALGYLGIACAQAGRTREAIEHLREAVRWAPEIAALHFNLGSALEDSGEPVEAARAFRRALLLDPGYTRARLALERVDGSAAERVETAPPPVIPADATLVGVPALPPASPVPVPPILPAAPSRRRSGADRFFWLGVASTAGVVLLLTWLDGRPHSVQARQPGAIPAASVPAPPVAGPPEAREEEDAARAEDAARLYAERAARYRDYATRLRREQGPNSAAYREHLLAAQYLESEASRARAEGERLRSTAREARP